MKTLKEVMADGEADSFYPDISLSKLTGRKIKDIVGSISTEYGDPVFRVFKIVFEDGAEEFMEGEHDCPYIPGIEGVENKQLDALHEEVSDYKQPEGNAPTER
jgi:hypothetical protein